MFWCISIRKGRKKAGKYNRYGNCSQYRPEEGKPFKSVFKCIRRREDAFWKSETGFDREERTWELIVKYFGDLSGLRERGIQVRELLSGYGILKVPEYLVDFVTNLPEIEYIEKPKRLFFAVNQARAASCLLDAARDWWRKCKFRPFRKYIWYGRGHCDGKSISRD